MTVNNILHFNISQDNDMPLYQQLLLQIRREIENGVLKPGSSIPSEMLLCSQYNLSRSTIRKALNQLVEENLIIRRRGKGSYVSDIKLNRNLNHLYNFTEDIIGLGLHPSSKVLENSIEEANESIMIHLNLPPTLNKVFKLVRLRLANNEPLLFETTYIPLYLCPDIVNINFSDTSLYNLLKIKYNLNFHKAIETYEAVKLNKKIATVLNTPVSTAAFKVQRIAYLDTGIPYEITNSYQIGKLCKFKVELYATPGKVNFQRETMIE